jgi:hypothetical protein
MDYTFNFTRIIKHLLFVSCLTLSFSVLADGKQIVRGACYSKYDAGDYKSALPVCKQAATTDDEFVLYFLGNMYGSGLGTPRNDKQAFYWYTRAAEQGNTGAQLNLGLMNGLGRGTLKNSIEAYAWFNVAAAQGKEQATKNRNIVEKKMTSSQIAEAQKLSKEYYAKYVK